MERRGAEGHAGDRSRCRKVTSGPTGWWGHRDSVILQAQLFSTCRLFQSARPSGRRCPWDPPLAVSGHGSHHRGARRTRVRSGPSAPGGQGPRGEDRPGASPGLPHGLGRPPRAGDTQRHSYQDRKRTCAASASFPAASSSATVLSLEPRPSPRPDGGEQSRPPPLPPPLPVRAHRRPLAPHRAPARPTRALPAPSPCEQRGGRPGGASAVPPGAPRGQTPPSLRSRRKDQLGPRNNAHERGLAPRGRISAFWGSGSFPAHSEKPGGSAEGFLGEVRPGDPVGRKDRPLSMALNSCPWAASDCKPNGPAEAAPGSSAFTSRSHSRYSSFGVSGRSCRGGSAVRAGAPPNDLGSGRRCRLGPRNSSARDSRCGAARPATHFIPPRRARWSHVTRSL